MTDGLAQPQTGEYLPKARVPSRLPSLFARASPYAVLLAGLLAATVVTEAYLYNGWAFRQRPFGLAGAASFEQGVSLGRTELFVVGSLPAVLLGAATAASLAVRSQLRGWAHAVAVDLALLVLAVFAGANMAAFVAEPSSAGTVWHFVWAHVYLAAASYALGHLVGTLMRGGAIPVSTGAWAFLTLLGESWMRWRLFRKTGYFELSAGHFPDWFYAAQVLLPVAAYRDMLILSQPGFRDALEQAALGDAVLPGWVSASTLFWASVPVWVILPLGISAWVSWHRGRRHGGTPEPGAAEDHPLPYLAGD